MGKPGPETKLVDKMRVRAKEIYGDRLVITTYHGGPFTQAGVSDLLVCLDGKFGACEVKAPENYKVKGKPSVEKALAEGPTTKQLAYIGRVNKAGGIACAAADMDGWLMFLETLDRGEWDED